MAGNSWSRDILPFAFAVNVVLNLSKKIIQRDDQEIASIFQEAEIAVAA